MSFGMKEEIYISVKGYIGRVCKFRKKSIFEEH